METAPAKEDLGGVGPSVRLVNKTSKHESSESRIMYPRSSTHRQTGGKWRQWFKSCHRKKDADVTLSRKNKAKKQIKVCKCEPVSGSATPTEAGSRRRNPERAKEAAGRSERADNGLPACEISLSAVCTGESQHLLVLQSPWPGTARAQQGYTLWPLSDHKKTRCPVLLAAIV